MIVARVVGGIVALRDPDSGQAWTIPAVSPVATAAKRWRFRRNLAIYLASRNGLSQYFLADVFDLPRSRVGEIVAELARFEPPEVKSRPGPPARPSPLAPPG